MKQGDKITLYNKTGHRRLQREGEIFQYGQRLYEMRDLDNPQGEPTPYLADYIDGMFNAKKAKVLGKSFSQNIRKRRSDVCR